MLMRNIINIQAVMTFLVIFVFAAPANAQGVGEVIIGNRVIFRFCDEGKNNASEKARQVQSRIDALLESSLGPSDVRAIKSNKSKGDYIIYWGSDAIVTVTSTQAKLNKTTTEALTAVWIRNFKEALEKGALFFSPATLEIPIHATAKVRVGGVAKGTIVNEYNGGNVAISIDQENNEIQIKGTSLGFGKACFRRGNARAILPIKVLDNPAIIPDDIETEVSGDPAPKEALQFAARSACRSSIQLKPGARIDVGENVRVDVKLDKGKTIVAYVPVVIKGESYFTINQEVPVTIKNIGEGFQNCKLLMVSDRPEKLTRDGILFQGRFSIDTPTRLLFYHQNADKKPRRLWIELKNISNESVHVMTGGAMGGPDRCGITVGHVAAYRFLETYQKALGYTIQIPPGKSVCLLDQTLQNDHIACGYFHLQIRKGKELEVLVKNSDRLEGDLSDKEMPIISEPFDPFRIHPKGVFQPANLEKDLEYVVGEDDSVTASIGRAPWLIDSKTGEPNNGNYGVFYQFNLKLKNPTSEPKRLGFYFAPKGNIARGTFIIDGVLLETILVRYPAELIFAAVDVKANSEKTIKILTTPEGGSYYPVDLVIKPADSIAGSPKPNSGDKINVDGLEKPNPTDWTLDASMKKSESGNDKSSNSGFKSPEGRTSTKLIVPRKSRFIGD